MIPPSDLIQPRSLEGVLFDFGRVLSGPPNPAAWAHMRELTAFEEEALHRGYWAHRHAYDEGKHTGEEYWHLVAADNGTVFTAEQVTALLAADNALWTDPNLPMIDWALRLHRSGIRIGILSNMGDAMKEGVLASFDWINEFDHHTWSHMLGIAKPAEAIYRHAAEGLGVAPGKILFIDDRPENIEAARAFGMHAIQYGDHAEFLREMEAQGFGSLLQPERRKIAVQRK
ncbi:MAG: HAD family phosphatase [Granulicella sp.]